MDMKQNKDRGTIKWTAMMLPEHVAMLRDLQHEHKKQPKPELEPQQLEEFEYLICEAMEFDKELTFVYWKNGFYEDFTGKAHYIDHLTKKLHIKSDEDEREYITIDCIISVT
ncbi:YolD-like family protein [Evansella clarkii]|uniref:YolD-like family protein n=1 Tax=Evansella clarkii TaxID=79879 RepID=UPI001FD13F5F|nr:YolD-like family protein [Evansella clarkii]